MNASNVWRVPSQMKRHLRTSMSGSKTAACRARDRAVDAVGGDDQVGVRELGVVLDLVLEVLLDAELAARSCRMFEQLLARDAAEAVAAACGSSRP